MSKVATISSLVRQAARSEAEFVETIKSVCAEESLDRVAEFFDRLNVPRSVEGDNLGDPLDTLADAATPVGTFEEEKAIGDGMQKYMERHLRKVKWHATRPSAAGASNAMLVMREVMMVTDLRLHRLRALLATKDELTPIEWSTARELMRSGYLNFRHFLVQFGTHWIDSSLTELGREDMEEMVGSFHELIDDTIRLLEEHREAIESRRQELTVLPEGFPPVKPPRYFGGDIMGPGPWRQYWNAVEDSAHHFREALA